MVLAGAVYVVVWKAGGYNAVPGQSATLTEWKDFVPATWTRGTTPLLIGQNVPLTTTSFSEGVVVVAQAVLVVLVAWSMARRFSAWRAWAFYGVVWAVHTALLGYGRLAVYGALVSLDLRYVTEFAYLIPLTLALAFASTEPHGGPVRGIALVRRVEASARSFVGAQRSVRSCTLVLLAAVWAASLANSYSRVEKAWPGSDSGAVTKGWLRGVDRVTAPGGPITLIDEKLPFAVVAGGSTRIADWIHLWRPNVRFDGPSGPLIAFDDDGTVRRARGVRTVFHTDFRPPGRCLPPLRTTDIATRHQPVNGARLLLQLHLSRPSSGRVAVWVDTQNAGYPATPTRTAGLRPRERTVRMGIGAGPVYALRLGSKPETRMCVDRVAVVAYR
jgi:hypothetical protein